MTTKKAKVLPGEIGIPLVDDDNDWATNNRSYTFGPVGRDDGSRGTVYKHGAGEIRAVLEAYGGKPIEWNMTSPPPQNRPYLAMFQWDSEDASFSINGKLQKRKPWSRA